MRTKKLLPLLLLATLLAVGLTGCDLLTSLFGTTIDARLNKLIAELNSSDRTAVWENFSQNTVNRDNAKPDTFWAIFPVPASGDTKYALQSIVTSGTTVTADMVGPSGWSLASRPAVFTMVQEGLDWKILEFDLSSVAVLKVLVGPKQ